MEDIMGKKKSSFICIILAFFILLSELYFEPEVSKYDLLCPYTKNSENVISPVSQKDLCKACTTRMLGIRDTSKYIETISRYNSNNSSAKNSIFYFFCYGEGSLKCNFFCNNYAVVHLKNKNNIYLNGVILTAFIHKSDGKKRSIC